MSARTIDPKAFLGRGWAHPVALDETGAIALVEYEEDVRQAILLIIGTDKGERVMRPGFGAGPRAFLFEPVNTTTLSLIQHRVEEALVTWEPRIDSVAVHVTARPEDGTVTIKIDYR